MEPQNTHTHTSAQLLLCTHVRVGRISVVVAFTLPVITTRDGSWASMPVLFCKASGVARLCYCVATGICILLLYNLSFNEIIIYPIPFLA